MRKMLKHFSITATAIVVLMAVTVLLIFDNFGAGYTIGENRLTDLPDSVIAEKERKSEAAKTCLILTDSTQESNELLEGHMQDVLNIMRVGFDTVDVSKSEIPDFDNYQNTVIAFHNLDALNEYVDDLLEWVQNGGSCMLLAAPTPCPTFNFLSRYMGVSYGGYGYASFSGINILNDFMIGSDGYTFHWDEEMSTAISCRLNQDATVYAVTDDSSETPLIWETDCGNGKFAVMNVGLCEKSTRGLTSAVYSLLDDTCIYPVINASAFFLDDFPSPVPMGDATYVRRDYNRSISSFYSAVWLPDVLSLSDKYGIKYTGALIDDYTEEVDGYFPQQTDTERFRHFGSLLLDSGGEIGLHGYNHLPLCFDGFDFKDKVDYKPWETGIDVVRAMNRALEFGENMYPGNTISVYVPPSNILSEEGRKLLHDSVPQIRVISSLYVEGEIEYEQEFEIAEDGIIEFPRVISGSLLDEHMRWEALNALNLYYVNSHFMHPDDVLDVDRGAEQGWAQLFSNLDNYCSWLYTSAPGLRNLTASDAGRATARFDCISIEREDIDKKINLHLGGFYDEAYLMVRCNTGKPVNVVGGEIEHISGDFYLLKATQDTVMIETEAVK